MQSEHVDLQRLRRAVDDGAARHGEHRSHLVGTPPVETEEHDPEERRLQSAEGEHVDEPDEARRRGGEQEDERTDDDGRRHGQEAQTAHRGHAPALHLLVHVDVLDDRRRGDDEQSRDRRNRRRQRPNDGDARKLRRHGVRDRLRDDVVDRAVFRHGTCQNAMREDAREIDADVHEADDECADDHRLVQSARVAVADAAHDGLRQRDRADADEQPLREVEAERHVAGGQRSEHRRMVALDRLQDRPIAAARFEHEIKQKHDADHHHDGAERVGQGDGAETADRRIDDDDGAEEHESREIAVARDCFEELRAADELRRHRAEKEQHDDEGGKVRERVRAEARTDDVDDGHGVEAAREERDALAEDAEHEEDRRDLHDRHVDPAEADLPRHAGAADKGADGAVGRDRRHGEHEAADRAVADEILRDEARAAFLAAHAHGEAHGEHEPHEGEQRHEDTELFHHDSPPFRASSSSSGMSRKTKRSRKRTMTSAIAQVPNVPRTTQRGRPATRAPVPKRCAVPKPAKSQ